MYRFMAHLSEKTLTRLFFLGYRIVFSVFAGSHTTHFPESGTKAALGRKTAAKADFFDRVGGTF